MHYKALPCYAMMLTPAHDAADDAAVETIYFARYDYADIDMPHEYAR